MKSTFGLGFGSKVTTGPRPAKNHQDNPAPSKSTDPRTAYGTPRRADGAAEGSALEVGGGLGGACFCFFLAEAFFFFLDMLKS